MSYTVIKTINGRQYEYLQTSYREGGKVRTKSVYVGPVGGRKRKRRGGGGFPPVNPAAIVLGGIALAMHVAKRGAKSPNYKSRNRPPDPRSARHMLERERQRWERRIEDAKGGWVKPKAKPEQDPAWRAFDEKLAAKAARQTAQDAPGRAKGAKAKDFTVDDEIEARDARFEAAVDEYNAGTTAAPDSPAPDGAPSPSGPHEP